MNAIVFGQPIPDGLRKPVDVWYYCGGCGTPIMYVNEMSELGCMYCGEGISVEEVRENIDREEWRIAELRQELEEVEARVKVFRATEVRMLGVQVLPA